MMNVTSGDAVLFAEEHGSGPPLILLHPFPANHEFWGPLLPHLASRYRVLVPDLRGSGESSAGEGAATMAKHAADIERLCQFAKINKAAFAGVSIGGYILLEVLRRYPPRVAPVLLRGTPATPPTP